MDSLQPTILIVDDEKHTRDGLRRLLEDEYDTYVAEDIRGAMDVLEREPIDVMITDLRLGGDDGMALIERAETAASADLHHDDGLRLGRHRGRSDEARRLRFRHQAAQPRQGRDPDRARSCQPENGTGNRTLRQQVDERYGLENIIGESPALHEVLDTIRPGRAVVGECVDRRRKRHGQGAGRARDS